MSTTACHHICRTTSAAPPAGVHCKGEAFLHCSDVLLHVSVNLPQRTTRARSVAQARRHWTTKRFHSAFDTLERWTSAVYAALPRFTLWALELLSGKNPCLQASVHDCWAPRQWFKLLLLLSGEAACLRPYSVARPAFFFQVPSVSRLD